MISDRDALEIADELLYRTGKGILTGDFAIFAKCFALPYLIETADRKRNLKTEDCLKGLFDDVRAYYKSMGVTDFARTVVSVEVLSGDSIGSTHVSRLLKRDGNPLKVPYPTYSVIQRINGVWLITSSIYAVLEDPILSGVLTPRSQKDVS